MHSDFVSFLLVNGAAWAVKWVTFSGHPVVKFPCVCRRAAVWRDWTNWSSAATRLHYRLDRRRAVQCRSHSDLVSRRQGLLTPHLLAHITLLMFREYRRGPQSPVKDFTSFLKMKPTERCRPTFEELLWKVKTILVSFNCFYSVIFQAQRFPVTFWH